MKIFVCGVDKSGKTTLTKRLASELNMKRIHFTCPKSVLTDDDHVLVPNIPVFNQIMNCVFTNVHSDVIFDRFIYSDIVYGPIYRTPDTLYFRQTEQTYSEMVMQSLGMIGIYAESSDIDKNITMLKDEGENVLDDEKFVLVRNRYRQLVSRFVHIVPTFRYDWTTTKYDDVKKFIELEKMRLNNNAFYQLLSESGMILSCYLGPIYRLPEHIVVVPDISYDSYVKAVIDHPEIIGNPNIAITTDPTALNKIILSVEEK